MKLVKEVNLGHIIAAVLLLGNLAAMYFNTQAAISSEAHAREAQDIKLSEQVRQTSEILREIRAEMKLNSTHRIKDEAKWE